EGTLTKWLKKVGDAVERDEPLFEISTDKVDTEIPSPSAGTLAEVLVEEGKTVGINTVVARISEGNGAGSGQSAAAAPPAAQPQADGGAAPQKTEKSPQAEPPAAPRPSAAPPARAEVPPSAAPPAEGAGPLSPLVRRL